jgi:excisionase family DNA binding protein
MNDDVERGLAMIMAVQGPPIVGTLPPTAKGMDRLLRAQHREWRRACGLAARAGCRNPVVPDPDGDVLDADRAAKMLGITRATLLRLARKGLIPAAKAGKGWRFSGDEVNQWVRARRGVEPDQKANGNDRGGLRKARPLLRPIQVRGREGRPTGFPPCEWSKDKGRG